VNGALDYLGVPSDGELVYSEKKKSDAQTSPAVVRAE
jgi:hypothetical protein